MKRSLPLATASLHRREFLRVAAIAAVAFGTVACSEDLPAEEAPAPKPDTTSLPSLGGAPDTPTGRAVAAFVDTIVPGSHRDPTGAPGALDVGAAALFFDPELPAAQYVGVLVVLLNAQSRVDMEGRDFVDLTVEERDRVVEKLLKDAGPLQFAVQLAKLAYLSSEGAASHLGYPGPNKGYVADADFSFRRPMSKEITSDGNLP